MSPPRRILSALALFTIACGILLTISCSDPSDRENASNPAVTTPIPVVTWTLADTVFAEWIEKDATLQSRVDLNLVAETAGVVQARGVRPGNAIAAGDRAVSFDDTVEEASKAAAQARLGALTGANTDRSAIAEAHADLSRAEEALRRRHVTAPVDGILDRYEVEVGAFVGPGTPVARLVDPTRLFAVPTVLQEEVSAVDLGTEVEFSVSPWPDLPFRGRVIRKAVGAKPGRNAFEVEIEITPDDRLLPGYVGTFRIPLRESRTFRPIPKDATSERYGTRRVLVAEPGDPPRAAEREVAVRSVPGRPDLWHVEQGLALGDKVIIRGRVGLSPGTPLQITEAEAPGLPRSR